MCTYNMNFLNLVSDKKWRSYKEHVKKVSDVLQTDINKALCENDKIRTEVRAFIERELNVKACTDDSLEKAKTILLKGKVAAIDGTHAIFQLLSGLCCQIGIATTSYQNEKTAGTLFVSEQEITDQEVSVLGILQRRKKSQKMVSRMLIQAIMFYMERNKALERIEEWLMFNGDLVPQPLRTGIGRYRALEPCLKMCSKVMNKKKVIGVLSNSTDSELLSLGLALNPGEYIEIRSYKEDLDEYLESSGLRGNDRALMEHFNNEYADQFLVGVYRAGEKAYVFHAHKDYFDEAASLIIRDSMFQPLRAYPLLIDYADSLCSTLMSSSDFKKMVECKLAKGKGLMFEQDEHALRRR